MTSEKQIIANRQNGTLSMGPISKEGQAVACMNATKHGLLSKQAIIKGESRKEYDAFKNGLYSSLAPMGDMEVLLVDRIVSSAWRLRRVIRIESLFFEGEKEMFCKQGIEGTFCGDGREQMGVLSRYEAAIERALFKALHELQRLQSARTNGLMLPPIAVDVSLADENGFVS